MEVLLNYFVVLFIVVDPLGVAPLFASLTRGAGAAAQRHMALRATALATVILLMFFFAGDGLLRLLGIGLPAFRIAGGALLFLLAIDMVFARQSGLRSTTEREQAEAEHKRDISVFPLAFPLIAGPGALTTVLLMSASAGGLSLRTAMVAVVLAVSGLTLFALLAALAVQYMLDGLHAAFPS